VTRPAYSRRHQLLRKLLAEARRQAKITQVALAKRLGRPQSFISKFESGERRLDVIELLDIADVLKLDPMRIIRQLQR
jgi:transcriptional regulator with XRE-family HTH domain